jgi:Flp pilus assembly pilin Flp
MYEALVWARFGARFAALKVAAGSRRAAKRLRDPSGQDLVEYGGILILVAAIIAALFAIHIPTDISNFVSSAVDSIVGNGAKASASGGAVSATKTH